MKVKLILGVLVVLLVVFSSLGSKNLYAQISEKFCYSEEEAKLYRMPINQVTPEDGIWTGHVIAYGHYIKPPYKIEVRDTLVFINNVQVYPALKTPGMIEKERIEKEEREARKKAVEEYIKTHQEEYEEMLRIDSMAKVLYEKEKTKEGKVRAVKSVVEFYKKCKGVDSVRITAIKNGEFIVCYSPNTVQYELQRIKGYPRPEHWTVRYEPYGKCASGTSLYKTKGERDKAMRRMGFPTTKQEQAEWWAKRFEESLSEGWAETFWTNGGDIMRESNLLKAYEILRDSKRSYPMKYLALRNFFTHKKTLAIIENYNPKDWESLRR